MKTINQQIYKSQRVIRENNSNKPKSNTAVRRRQSTANSPWLRPTATAAYQPSVALGDPPLVELSDHPSVAAEATSLLDAITVRSVGSQLQLFLGSRPLLQWDYSRPAYYPWRTAPDYCTNYAVR